MNDLFDCCSPQRAPDLAMQAEQNNVPRPPRQQPTRLQATMSSPTAHRDDLKRRKPSPLGLVLVMDEDDVVVESIARGSVAGMDSRIRAGDLLLAVDGVEIKSVVQAQHLLVGEANSHVQLVLGRVDEKGDTQSVRRFFVTLIRE
ncbi:hypothetical protein GUITHDRAFT_109089 [Guillardia theta CCMP2712]|uniref:PDZ domain-containing protein n=1 Tax=Guillardia theta (strain CCMP2712) TaxID=905079 RepID=L1J941_GUITC|nr:hypothetical protein GUITHDRAFT_109089 [Guillardia theta CCMP2712]EKX45046.1 hypothetical protein GUITHDRAFT_109089 [Guillardia theta CCMP2712]|eukprot:XP_005832026.1 hypothetical protein GUITHDRAFT_109089 [Guillardia theta CCMP2712]